MCLGENREVTECIVKIMIYFIEDIGLSLSLLYRYSQLVIILSCVTRLALISCTSYFTLLINLYPALL